MKKIVQTRLSKVIPAAWLLLLLPVLTPLLRPGFFVSDDGQFHVYRIAALADAWRGGVLHPRLFPDFGFGYGQAVLNFYSPLSYWPGAALSLLGMSPAQTFQWTVALGFVLAALAAFGYIRSLWGTTAGILAALVYTYLPYHLADAYTRGALPEHMAFIFPPLILWAYSAAFRKADSEPEPAEGNQQGKHWSIPLLWGSLAWAGLVLTHNLTTLLMALAAIPHLLILAAWSRDWRRLIWAGLSLLLAMGLSAGYWLPVLAESGAVGIGGGPSQGFINHLLDLGNLLVQTPVYPYRDASGLALVYPLSWLAPLFLVVGLAGVTWLAWRPKTGVQTSTERGIKTVSASYHLALALAAIAMTTTLTLPLWLPLTPVLGHLQYPWRFLVLAAVGLMGSAALLPQLLSPLGARVPKLPGWTHAAGWIGITGVLALVALPGLPMQPLDLPAAQVWSPQRMWQGDADTGQIGATWTGEFLPTTVSEQRWALGRPNEAATDTPPLSPDPTSPNIAVTVDTVGHGRMSLTVNTAIPFELSLHQFAQPGWNARVDGAPVPVTAAGELGLASVDLAPSGAGTQQVSFVFGPTPARRAGTGLALVAVLLWAVLAWKRPTMRWAAGLLSVGALILALNGLGLGVAEETPHPVQAQLGDTATLIGHTTAPALGERALDVTLYWFAQRETRANLSVFVHLLGPDGGVIAQRDSAPVGGFSSTNRWRAGEIIADTHRIPLPEQIGPGVYGLRAGMYEPATVTNLPVHPPMPDNRVDLGTVTVGP